MGTKFRTMLAPIGLSTGDGRRFAQGGISLAETPFALEWVRVREDGHNGAVGVGVVQQAHIGTVAEAIANDWIGADQVGSMRADMMAVWASGEMYDGVDRERMPRLAEDVATAMHLITEGTLGPSVDLDSFQAVPVMAGSDSPMTEQEFEAHFDLTGQEPKLELLITEGRVRAATLVSIPAFAETCRPLELIATEPAAETPALALLASVGVVALPAADAFSRELPGPTPITYDHETGQIYGHIATWKTCHVGYADVCVVAPKDPAGGEYASFNRYPVETADGVVWAGRLTVGGRHAGLSLTAAGAMREHDGKTVAGYVRAYEDAHGIAVAGVLEPGLDEAALAILSRRKVSGDWRETAAGLSLVEVLALAPGPRAHSEPGFPVGTFSRAGRQVALVASLGPEAQTVGDAITLPREPGALDIGDLAHRVVTELRMREARESAAAQLSTMIQESARPVREALLADLNRGK